MCTRRDMIVFLAGAATIHTLTHLVIQYSDTLPIKFFSITWDKQYNLIATVVSAVITLGLYWWASQTK